VHGYRGSQQKNKSVRYGFGTAEIFVPVIHSEQHVFQGRRGAFNGPYSPYGHCTVALKSGHDFPEVRKSVQSVRYGCLCTDFEVAAVGFLPVHFKHGKRREEISKLLVLFLLM
jgi:hypothetical protein